MMFYLSAMCRNFSEFRLVFFVRHEQGLLIELERKLLSLLSQDKEL